MILFNCLIFYTFLIYLNNIDSAFTGKKTPEPVTSVQKTTKDLKKHFNISDNKHSHKNSSKTFDENLMSKNDSPYCDSPNIQGKEKLANLRPDLIRKWSKKNLTFYIMNESQKLKNQTKRIINEAFKYWSNVSIFTFTEVGQFQKADIKIKFASGIHGDGYSFDGPEDVIGHAFSPENGEIHFDDHEKFTDNSSDGYNLKIIAIHLIGHALGLKDSNNTNSVMYPHYNYNNGSFKLTNEDIDRLNLIYSDLKHKDSNKTTTKTITTTQFDKAASIIQKHNTRSSFKPTESTTASSKINRKLERLNLTGQTKYYMPCVLPKQSIFLSNFNLFELKGPDKSNIYVLMEGESELFVYDLKNKIWKGDNLTSIYSRLPIDAKGGVQDKNGITWFFKDKDIFAFNGTQLAKGFPRTVKDSFYPANPNTAAIKDKKLYIFKDTLVYEFDTDKLVVKDFLKIHEIFAGLPKKVDSYFKYEESNYFFFENNVYIYDEKLKKVANGFPKEIKKSWFPCL